MADGIVVTVGPQGAGHDYQDIETAYAEMPSDITATSGDYVFEIYSGVNLNGAHVPDPVTDSSHKVIHRAAPGHEVDGTGTGAGFESSTGANSEGFIGTTIQSQHSAIVEYHGLKIAHLSGGSSEDSLYFDDVLSVSFFSCFIKSIDGDGLETENGAGANIYFENCIIADCGGLGTRFNNIGGSAFIEFNRVSIINCTVGFNDRGFGNRDNLRIRNCLGFGNSNRDFASKIDQSDCDFLASGDTTANDAATTSFTNRTSADFVDYAGGNYSLASDSTLKGAGENGEDIGATLGIGADPEPSGTEQPVTLINAVQGEHAPALPIVQSQQVVGQQAVQAESATSLLIATIQQIAQQNARQNESAQSSAVTQEQPVASNPAVQNENAVQMQIEQSGAQSVVLNNAVQNEMASALTVELQQNLIATVAQQLEYAELSNVTQVQAVTLATATQAESAAPLNIEQYSGQLVTLVAAQQAESAPALFISTTSAVAVNPALQQESAAATNIQQSQQLIQVSAVQLEYAEILRIITSGDQTDLSGLRLVPVTDIYSLNPINPVTYTLRKL